MAARSTLILISVACAILLVAQLTEARDRYRREPQELVFPEETERPDVWPPRPPPRPVTTSTTTRRPITDGCSCPTTSEYNPVCGTDGVSYSNPGKMNCARNCGKDVSILHYGNCTPPDPNAPSTTSSTTQASTTAR